MSKEETSSEENKERLKELFFLKGVINVNDDNGWKVIKSKEELQDFIRRHPERWYETKHTPRQGILRRMLNRKPRN